MDTQRVILFFIFAFSVLMLGDQWFREQRQAQQAATAPSADTAPAGEAAVPGASGPLSVPTPKPTEKLAATAAAPAAAETGGKLARGERIRVTTDLVVAEIDTAGGDLRYLELLRHKHVYDYAKNFVLLQDAGDHTYVAQSGLIGEGLPNHRSRYRSAVTGPLALADGQDTVSVRLEATDTQGAVVSKTYVFRRGSYLIDVTYELRNTGKEPLANAFAYFQLIRDSRPPVGDSWLVPTYTGFVVYTEAEKYQKVAFDDVTKNKARFAKNAPDGWLGVSQHYFVSAWLPPEKLPREFYLRALEGGLFSGGIILPVAPIEAGGVGTITVPLYSGPQEQDKLGALAKGLDLTVDYGLFTIFATPLFWLLKWIHEAVGNWGVAIIVLTILIKIAFYPLSAASYKSMAKMRVLAPKLQRLKEQYGDDRQKMQQAMMELYRTEKINPLGGCLPIVVQIPIFIALYWVLLGSVELRQAPFFGWVTDLSVPDPWFVLPLLMGATMIIQMKLSPEPPDPIQARVMKIMPIVFSVFFFFFPAGLVLYWLVNNVLSIAQQWYVTRQIEAEKAASPHAGKR